METILGITILTATILSMRDVLRGVDKRIKPIYTRSKLADAFLSFPIPTLVLIGFYYFMVKTAFNLL